MGRKEGEKREREHTRTCTGSGGVTGLGTGFAGILICPVGTAVGTTALLTWGSYPGIFSIRGLLLTNVAAGAACVEGSDETAEGPRLMVETSKAQSATLFRFRLVPRRVLPVTWQSEKLPQGRWTDSTHNWGSQLYAYPGYEGMNIRGTRV